MAEKDISERIDLLKKEGFHLEAFYYYSVEIEYLLQKIILEHQNWLNHVVKRSGYHYENLTEKEIQKLSLGQLIKQFSKHCTNKALIEKLNAFNSFRVKHVHHIHDYSINTMNNQAKAKTVEYYKLAIKLNRYYTNLLKKIIRTYSR